MARHAADLVSLAFGLLFAGIGLALFLPAVDVVSLEWVLPVTAIAIGALFIVAGRSRRSDADAP
jgi:hypothetical protein